MTLVSALLFTVVFMGCGSDPGNEKEKDAQKLADIMCDMRLIALNLEEGDFEGLTRFTQKMAEFSELSHEITHKYELQEDDEEFELLIRSGLRNTPCRDVDLDDLFDFF